jgi:hypothetical protein
MHVINYFQGKKNKPFEKKSVKIEVIEGQLSNLEKMINWVELSKMFKSAIKLTNLKEL